MSRVSDETYDYVVIGSGITGLFTAALLANDGAKVLVLERHYLVGGYAQSFPKNGYLFCAGLHYVFNCLPDEDGGRFLRRIGLADTVRFSPMSPDGFDRVRFPSLSYDIVSGAPANVERLSRLFPKQHESLRTYYDTLGAIYREAFTVPVDVPIAAFLRHPLRLRHLLRYRNVRTREFMERLGMPTELRDVLSAQCGNIGVPPERSSFLAHALNVMAYDQGACFPTYGYHHMLSAIARVVRKAKGCKIRLETPAEEIVVEGGRAVAVRLRGGELVRTKNVLLNADPKLFPSLVQNRLPWTYRRRLAFEHSAASYTLYIGLRGVDLRAHGFGSHNVWHFPQHDLDEVYRRQLEQGDVSDPFFAITTPTLHGRSKKKIAPDGCEQMVLCTWAGYDDVAREKATDETAYRARKTRLAERALDLLERHYIGGVRAHVDVLEVGTPTTNEDYVAAPVGASYGASLTPGHVNLGKLGFETPLPNVVMANATSGMPGLGGAFRTSLTLHARLTRNPALEAELLAPRALRSPLKFDDALADTPIS